MDGFFDCKVLECWLLVFVGEVGCEVVNGVFVGGSVVVVCVHDEC